MIAFFKMSLPLLWRPQEKIKFWFIQEPWMYFLVKSQNSRISYIINIMTFSKFDQEIYFYLLVASLHLIRSKLKIFIHWFTSCWFPCHDDGGRYHKETSPLVCGVNQWTGFYMITTSVMKGLNDINLHNLLQKYLDFKSCFSEENMTKNWIFESNYFF